MNKATVWALVVGLVAVCLWKCGSGPVAEIVEDYRESRHWQQEIAASNEYSAALKESLQRILERKKAKDRIVRDLMDGRITVREAGRLVAALSDAPPSFMEYVRQMEPGKTDHERLCWHIIDYACKACESESEGRELRRRLTQELEASLRDDGGVLSLDRVVAQ